ncbi:MAG TPA: hypothetical protein VFQ61_11450, partial [Polyangiaceae bacterium]|nr:hypothetical protein [Polyangiaceae bacterium]
PGSGRIFVPVRGDATLHWADVGPDGHVACGQENNGGACDDLHRAGNDPEQENTRDLRLGAEPFGIAASWNGEAIMVTNQTSGAASLFVNPWLNQENDAGPKLEFRLEQLSSRPVGVTAVPPPARILAQPAVRNGYAPAFLVTFRNTPEVVLVRYYSDSEYVGRQEGSPNNVASPSRPFVTRLGTAFASPNSPGTDSRGIVADDASRRELEQRCFAAAGITDSCLSDYGVNGKEGCIAQAGGAGAALDDCLAQASRQPLDFFVASRSPASLLVGSSWVTNDAIGNNEIPSFYDSIPLTVGPSRVVTGEVIVGGDAQVITDAQEDTLIRERRVFVVSFDSRRVFIYDPVRRRLDAEVTTGRGPYAISVDSKHGHLYIGQFTDSFISVVSLDRRHPRTYAQVLATIGAPSAPRTSK